MHRLALATAIVKGRWSPCATPRYIIVIGLLMEVRPMTGRWFAALALLVLAAPAACAAEWPARPIRIIAPSTPGGAADTFARLLAEFLPPLLHQPLIVDNRAGGGGVIGAAAAALAEPDGDTLVTPGGAYHSAAPARSA